MDISKTEWSRHLLGNLAEWLAQIDLNKVKGIAPRWEDVPQSWNQHDPESGFIIDYEDYPNRAWQLATGPPKRTPY